MNQTLNKNADFCGKVPLNQTNLIQPHGVLMIVNKTDFTIIQTSENCVTIFGKNAKEMLHTSLSDYLNNEEFEKMVQRFSGKITGKIPFTFSLSRGNFVAIIQPLQQYLIIEVELEKKSANPEDSFIAVYQELKYVMAEIESCTTTLETCQAAIRELKKISGFDKIMIYQFDEEWNGNVIAEVKENGMESYLGLKFPASDIPKQARDLYQRTPYRLIPDVEYEPVRLYPVINPVTNAFTDLSDSNLRSVARVHIEYLKNMGVMASMSTRILVNNQLWGLISCHHRSAKFLSFEMCSIFELLSTIISAKIAAVQSNDLFSYKSGMQELFTKLVEDVYRSESLAGGLNNSRNDLLELLNAEGIVTSINKNIEVYGTVPDKSDIEDLIIWLQSRSNNSLLFHQQNLASEFEPAEKYASVASGVLALPIQPEKGNYILAFRPEAVKKVSWGGNPNEVISFDPDGKNYHPRNSFKMWQQTVHQTSLPWKPEELQVAEQFRNFVVDYTLNKIYS